MCCTDFSSIFLARVLPQVYFDVIIRVRVTPRVAQQYGPQLLDRGNWVDFANHFVLTVLSQGLSLALSC